MFGPEGGEGFQFLCALKGLFVGGADFLGHGVGKGWSQRELCGGWEGETCSRWLSRFGNFTVISARKGREFTLKSGLAGLGLGLSGFYGVD